MRFTDEPAPHYGSFLMDTLQVFSVKVEGIGRRYTACSFGWWLMLGADLF
jgi:hypothetical protein